MSSHYHAVVWLDHHEARVIHFGAGAIETEVVHPEHPPRHLHVKSGSPSGTHLHGDPAFYADVAKAVGEAKAVLLVGPSTAKTEFMSYLRVHAPRSCDRYMGIESTGRLTDPQLLAEGRRFFSGSDRMTPQAV